MTNVKKGDVAQIIKATHSYHWTLGRVVRIGSICCFTQGGMPAWKFEEPLRHGTVMVGCAPDSFLKRIDPLTPGEIIAEADQAERPRKRQRVKTIPILEQTR